MGSREQCSDQSGSNKGGIFLKQLTWALITFSRRTLLHGLLRKLKYKVALASSSAIFIGLLLPSLLKIGRIFKSSTETQSWRQPNWRKAVQTKNLQSTHHKLHSIPREEVLSICTQTDILCETLLAQWTAPTFYLPHAFPLCNGSNRGIPIQIV
jgi:hypothetical protein